MLGKKMPSSLEALRRPRSSGRGQHPKPVQREGLPPGLIERQHLKLVRREGLPPGLTEKDAQETGTLAARAAIEKLETLVTKDTLTGLENRRSFGERMERAFGRFSGGRGHGEEHEKAISIVFCDIDHFKTINDRFGHAAGDAALKAVAEVLRNKERPEDSAARWGGEEFVLGFVGMNESEAIKRAEEIRTLIEGLEIVHDGKRIKITMSFGVTSTDKADSLTLAVKQADEALYEAKGGGRNRVVSWTGSPDESQAGHQFTLDLGV